jgi:hypothetical protein
MAHIHHIQAGTAIDLKLETPFFDIGNTDRCAFCGLPFHHPSVAS